MRFSFLLILGFLLQAAAAAGQQADLEITLDDGGISVPAGGTVIYQITYRNLGPGGAAEVVIRDVVPDRTNFDPDASTPGWSCAPDGSAGSECVFPLTDLHPGAQGTLALGFQLDLTVAGVIENTATVETSSVDPDLGNNTATDETPVIGAGGAPDLALTKQDDADPVDAGDLLTYTLTYSNLGSASASGVVIAETVPEHTTFDPAASSPEWSCLPDGFAGNPCTYDLGGLPAGGTPGSVLFAVRVDDPLDAGVDRLANLAEISDDGSNGPDADPNNNDASEDTLVGTGSGGGGTVPDYLLMKDDGGISADAGEVVVYTLTYANAGNQGGSGVTIAETVPNHATFDPAASAAGWSCVPDGSAGSACTLVVGSLPGGGGSGTAAFAVRVDDPLPAGVTSILNAASITDDGMNGPDPNPLNNEATDATPIGAGGGTAPDLTIGKDDGGQLASPGGTITYTLAFANAGNRGASGVVVTETVPAHTAFDAAASDAGWSCAPDGSAGSSCTFAVGTVEVGDGGTVIFAITVDPALPAGVDAITNTVNVSDDGTNGADLDPTDNVDVEMTGLDASAAPDLAVGLDDGGVTVSGGEPLLFTISYANHGTRGATGAGITVLLPTEVAPYLGASDPGWSCASILCSIDVGTVASGATGSALLAVTVADPLPIGLRELVTMATLADDGTNGADLDPTDNTAQESTPVEITGGVDLAVEMNDDSATVDAGDTIRFQLAYRNLGERPASGVELRMLLPLHTTFLPASSTPGWSCQAVRGGGAALCTLAAGTLSAGSTAGAEFALRVDNPLAAGVDRLVHRAEITDDGASGDDLDPSNNSVMDDTAIGTGFQGIGTAPDLSVVLDDGGASVVVGETLVYTVSLFNLGNQAATGVLVRAGIPVRSSFDPALSSPGWVCGPGLELEEECRYPLDLLNGGGEGMALLLGVKLDEPLPAAVYELHNLAIIEDDGRNGPDQNPTDNRSRVTTVVGESCADLDCYYSEVDESSPERLRQTLHDAIDDHRRIPRGTTAWWIALEVAEEDPTKAGWVVDVLRNRSFRAAGGPGGGYQPFTPWPGLGKDDPAAVYPLADLHAHFLVDERAARRVAGRLLDRCESGCWELPTWEREGRGGGRGVYPGGSNWLGQVDGLKVLEPWRDRRGDLARALLYLDLRYAGGRHADGTPELALTLRNRGELETERYPLDLPTLDTLLDWHREDPVSDRERWRNEVVHTAQGNRNPFIDRPEWVGCVYEGRCEDGSER